MRRWILMGALALGAGVSAEEADEASHYRGVTLNDDQIEALGLRFAPLEPVTEVKGYAWPAMVDIPLAHRDLLAAPVGGKIRAIHVVHGEVRAGQPVIELESAELVRLQQGWLNALAQLDQAERRFRRAQRLRKAGSLSEKQFLAEQTALKEAQTAVKTARSTLDMVGLTDTQLEQIRQSGQLQRTLTLTAPKDGLLFDLQVERNQRVEANAPLGRIGEVGEVIVDVDLPLAAARRVRLGQKVVIAHQPLSGRVAYVAHRADPVTQRVKVHVLFDNTQRALLPGAFVRVHFIEQARGVRYYRVPVSSIVSLDGTPAVFLKEPAHLEVQAVEIRYRDNQWAIVQLRGVEEDAQEVVSHGAIFLKGMMEAAETDTGGG